MKKIIGIVSRFDLGDWALLVGLLMLATGIALFSVRIMLIVVGSIVFLFGLADFCSLIGRRK